MSANQESADYADQAITVLLEDLLAGSRVLWIGETEGGAPERISSVATSVLVLETSGKRPRRRVRGVTMRPYRDEPIELDEDFDAVVVTDMEALGAEPDARLAELAESVRGGPVLVGHWAENDEAYGRFVGLLEEIFGAVRIYGQASFKAYAVAELGGEAADDVVVDGSLAADDEAPARFLALCSKDAPPLPACTIVQVPRLTAPASTIMLEDPEESAEGEALQGRLEAAEEHAEELERALAARSSENTDLRVELQAARVELEEALRVPAPAPPSVVEEPAMEPAVVESAPVVEEPPVRASQPPARELTQAADAAGHEVSALEGKLKSRARRLAEAEREVERRGVVARDLIEHLWELTTRGPEVADLHAVERAVRAEAELSAARFEMDELRARMASAGGEAEATRERHVAELAGRVRGLEARLAEEVEQREVAAARLQLAMADLEDGRERERRLEAEAATTREDFELELIRAREASSRVERVAGSVDEMSGEVERLRASEARLSERVGTLSGELMATRDLLERREGELRERGEVAASPPAGDADLLALGDELAALVAEKERLEEAVAARDGLVTRLQIDLAEVEQVGRNSDELLTKRDEENARLRQALVEASTAVDAREAAEARVRELEASLVEQAGLSLELERARREVDELTRARLEGVDALRETRGILAGIDEALGGERRSGTAVDLAAPDSNWEEPGAGISVGASSDADTMLRSLTAQLEARNDRIRALERMITSAGGESQSAAGPETMELEARAERLEAEAERERERRHAAEKALEVALRSSPGDGELVELRAKLDARAAELEAMTGRAATFERDIDSLREVFGQAQSGLDSLLELATASGNPQLAERVAALISVVGRF